MSGSTTRRFPARSGAAVRGLLAAGALALASCGPPRPLDTGEPLIEADRPMHHLLWQKDIGRAIEYPALGVEGTWLLVTTDGKLHRLAGETGEELWKRKLPASPTGPPVLCGSTVVVATDSPSGEILGVDLASGEERWRWGRALARTAGRDSLLFVAARRGRVVRLDPETGDEVWTVELNGAGWKDPVLLGDRGILIVPARPDSVIALRAGDGSRVWGIAEGPWPVVAGGEGFLIGAADDSVLTVLDPETGAPGRSIPLGGMPAGPPRIAAGMVYVAVRTGVLFAMRADDLGMVWKQELDPPLVSPPLVHEDLVLQAAARGRVFGLDRTTGAIIGFLNHPEALIASPVVQEASLAVGGNKGTLAVYRREP